MKKSIHFFLVLSLSCLVSFVDAQIPAWLWAKSAGAASYDYAQSVVTDSLGNCYVAGYFNISIAFDINHTLISSGSSDLYIVKYDPIGNVIWAKSASGNGAEISSSLAVDKSGNIYLAGYFKSTALVFGTTTLTNAGGNTYDVFVVKYDPSGSILWAKSAGGTGDDRAYGVAVDRSGNCFITGYFVSSSITFGTSTLTNTGFSDIFITKYSPDGTVLWAKSPVGPGWEYTYGIATDRFGNSYLTGKLNGNTLTFGAIILTKTANHDMFVAKYASDGSILWAKNAGVSGDNVANCVSADLSGNCYVSGRFGGGSIKFGSVTLPNAGSGDMFLVKYDLLGNVLWAKSAGGTLDDVSTSVTTDKLGYSYAAGYFKSLSISFGSHVLTNNNSGSADVFVSEYDPDGNIIWAVGAGGTGDDMANAMAVDTLRNFYLAGYIGSPTVVFGNNTLTSNGTTDMFVAKSSNTPVSGISDPKSIADFSAFPNPAKEFITVSLSLDNATIELIDLQGRICKKLTGRNGEITLDIRDMLAGIYLIKVTTSEMILTQKFIKE